MRSSDWSSDVCSSDLLRQIDGEARRNALGLERGEDRALDAGFPRQRHDLRLGRDHTRGRRVAENRPDLQAVLDLECDAPRRYARRHLQDPLTPRTNPPGAVPRAENGRAACREREYTAV